MSLMPNQIEELEEIILDAKEIYYTGGKPPFTDEEYDGLVAMLPDDRPLKRHVGYKIKDRDTVPHLIPMGSLDKATNPEELHKWLSKRKNPVLVEQPKHDGSSVEFIVYKGKLLQAITRGEEGIEGLDCTSKLYDAFKRSYLPELSLKYDSVISKRGEVVVFNEDWEKIKETYKDRYTNQRNIVAGILNSKYDKDNEPLFSFLRIMLFYDDDFKFEGVNFYAKSPSKIENLYEHLENSYRKILNTTLCDGMVLLDTSVPMTFDKHNYPQNMIAVKFKATEKTFVVNYIDWEISRHGRCVPTLVFSNPTELDGSIIERATGFNYAFIKDEKIGPGTIVTVAKGGNIIPDIQKVLKNSGDKWDNIDQCPCCGCVLDISGVDKICPNLICKDRIVKQLTWFLQSMGVENFASKNVEQLYTGIVGEDGPICLYHPEQFYNLTEEFLLKFDGWEKIKVKKFLKELEKSKSTTEVKLLTALGVPGVGSEIWKNILKRITINDLFESSVVNESFLCAIENIGKGRAQTILDSLRDPTTYTTYKTLRDVLSIKREVFVENDSLEGITFCITGATDTSRKEFIDLIKKYGGKHSTSNFSYLITNFPEDMTGKRKQADKIAAKIISEDDFFELLEEKLLF